jgi:RES domain-containing protein
MGRQSSRKNPQLNDLWFASLNCIGYPNLKLYRIASFSHKIYSGLGAAIVGGRWNRIGQEVIYAATSLSAVKLELLAHVGFKCVPQNYGFVEITFADTMPITKYPRNTPPKMETSKTWGDKWLLEKRTAVALLPSAASPGELIAMINPAHEFAVKIEVSTEKPVKWDKRHFTR